MENDKRIEKEIKELKKLVLALTEKVAELTTSTKDNPKDWETIESCHERTGISKSTLYYLKNTNQIPFKKVGRRIFLKLIS